MSEAGQQARHLPGWCLQSWRVGAGKSIGPVGLLPSAARCFTPCIWCFPLPARASSGYSFDQQPLDSRGSWVQVGASRKGCFHAQTPLPHTHHPPPSALAIPGFSDRPPLASTHTPNPASTDHTHHLLPPRIITTAGKCFPPPQEPAPPHMQPIPRRARPRTVRVLRVTYAPAPSCMGRCAYSCSG